MLFIAFVLFINCCCFSLFREMLVSWYFLNIEILNWANETQKVMSCVEVPSHINDTQQTIRYDLRFLNLKLNTANLR